MGDIVFAVFEFREPRSADRLAGLRTECKFAFSVSGSVSADSATSAKDELVCRCFIEDCFLLLFRVLECVCVEMICSGTVRDDEGFAAKGWPLDVAVDVEDASPTPTNKFPNKALLLLFRELLLCLLPLLDVAQVALPLPWLVTLLSPIRLCVVMV